MLRIDLRDNLKDVMNEVGVFTLDEQRLALSRALNAAARGVVTDAPRKIRERFKQLKIGEIKDAFSIRFATPDNPVAIVTVKGGPLSLARFVSSVITQRGKGGVWVNIKGERKFFPHAWIQTMKNSKGGDYIVVMARVGKERKPVVVFHTIDYPGAFSMKEVVDFVEEQTGMRFDKALGKSLIFLEGNR